MEGHDVDYKDIMEAIHTEGKEFAEFRGFVTAKLDLLESSLVSRVNDHADDIKALEKENGDLREEMATHRTELETSIRTSKLIGGLVVGAFVVIEVVWKAIGN